MPKVPKVNPALDGNIQAAQLADVFARGRERAAEEAKVCAYPGCKRASRPPTKGEDRSKPRYCDNDEHNDDSAAESRGDSHLLCLEADARDGDKEAAFELNLLLWRPKTEVVDFEALELAVEERADHATEFSDWFHGDGFRPSDRRSLWMLDGAHAVAQELRDAADVVLRDFVNRARRDRCSWSEVARHLGVTKAAVIARYGGSNDA